MPRNNRQALAQQLVELQTEIEPTLGKIDAIKEDLRPIAEEDGQGFTEEVDGGKVEVRPGREKEFKGLLPTLDAQVWLGLSEGRRQKLTQDGLVTMIEQWSPGARPSVTVRL